MLVASALSLEISAFGLVALNFAEYSILWSQFATANKCTQLGTVET